MLRKPLAFIKKEFWNETSYKTSFIFEIFEVLISILVFFFIDKLFGQKIVGHLEKFNVNYFSYVLVSMAFFSYVGLGLSSFAGRIRGEQRRGTLEAIILTPTRLTTILFSLTLWNLLFATIDLALYISFGIFLFKIDFSNINIFSTLIIFVLTVFTFNSLGIISASFILAFKRGNPVDWVIKSVEGLICGVYFPVTVLPVWLQFVAKFFPITYAIRAIQLAVYKGYTPFQLAFEITVLFFFALILVPLSLICFRVAFNKARMDGSLLQY